MLSLKLPAALAAAALMASAAQADVIEITPDDIGRAFALSYDGYADGQVIEGLSSETILTVTNTSVGPIDASRVSIFGFNTNPDIASAKSDGTFDMVATNANVPAGFGGVDVCFKASGQQNSCSGGGGEGLWIGESGSGSLTLTFSSLVDQVALSDFFVRYQSIDGAGAPGSAIGRGTVTSSGSTSTGSTSTGGTQVPAPGALWLFAGGLALLGWRIGRRRGAVGATA
jgi:hypothetical protein